MSSIPWLKTESNQSVPTYFNRRTNSNC